MHWIQHSVCGGVITEKVWIDHHHELYAHNKHLDALSIYFEEVIYPVIKSQGCMVKTPMYDITWQNHSILVATDQGTDLNPNDLLTHSDPNSFLFASQYSTYYKNGVVRDLPPHN